MNNSRYQKDNALTTFTDKSQQHSENYVWNPWTPLKNFRSRLTLIRGDGYKVWDKDGNEYIDAASLNMTCGYKNPTLLDAISQQILKLHGVDLSVVSNEPARLLAERLYQVLPDRLSKTLFVNSGSEGFEAAIFIATAYWSQIGLPRSRVVTFARGYHGSTFISRSLSGLAKFDHPLGKALPVTYVELPVPPRELRKPEALSQLVSAFEKALNQNSDDLPACVVIEPFLNVGGGVVLPFGFLRELRKLCDEAGTFLILDEVFTGYGRSGKMFAFQHEDIVPDILVSSKGLASGYMPITAVTVQERIHDSFEKDPILGGLRYGHTTSGHPVACAAALATLDILENEKLADCAQNYGKFLVDRLADYAGVGNVVDVRGFGLVLILEMRSPDIASKLRTQAESLGLLLRQAGNGEVLMAVPPLTIDPKGIEKIIERLKLCLREQV